MKKHSPANERIKRKYFAYLKEAKRHSEPTVDTAGKALSRFEGYALRWGLLVNLKRQAWRGTTGALHHPFAQYFEKPLFEPICRISIRIASEIPLSNSGRMSV